MTGHAVADLNIRAPRVPSRRWFDPVLGAHLNTGAEALAAVDRFVSRSDVHTIPIAADIETPGLDRSFEINCVTAAWAWPDGSGTEAILLDPARDRTAHMAVADLFNHAKALIFHNAAFDVPPLYHAGLLNDDTIRRIIDTVVLARYALPEPPPYGQGKKLEQLATKFLGWTDSKGGMERAFKAAGYKTNAAGFEGMDIDAPIYRFGAMADTVATLELEPVMRDMCVAWSTDHPFVNTYSAATTRAEALDKLGEQETVHRVMLRRSAVGLNVDRDYLTRYQEEVDVERNLAIAALAAHGLEGGTGKGAALVKYLDARGELPQPWPRTPKGALRATKADLDALAEVNSLAGAQRKLATIEKVMVYLDKVSRQAEVTGRCHPQVGVLGASATGRMCIPTTHRILTRRGVLTHDEVQVGDETIDMNGQWSRVTGVHRYPDQDTIIYRSRLTTLEATDEHRWVSRSESGGGWRVGPLELSQRRSVLLVPEGKYDITARTIDAQTDGETLAAVVGMLITDGRCTVNYAKGGRGDMRAHIYQSTRKFYTEFRRVIPDEALMYDRVLDRPGDNENHEMRLKTRWLRPRLAKAGLDGAEHLTANPNLVSWVLGLSERECAAFLTAAYLGDGIADPAGGQRMIAQREQARHALMVAAYRLGVRCTRRSVPPTGWGTDDIEEICFQTAPHIHTRHMEIDKGRCDVWCVTTESGTFTAFSDMPYLTGNSYGSPELQQFPKPARAIIADDGQGLTSIDWSQIEPVTMALMAKDEAFLAPFEAGADLYEPIMRSCGCSRDVAKVVLLSTMYGSGVAKMAATIGHTEESAAQIRRQMFNAMKRCEAWMAHVQEVAYTTGRTITVGGRILPVDEGGVFKAVNYCLSPHTLILRSDLTHVRADTIAVGDRLVAFDEHPQREGDNLRKYHQMRTATVEAVSTVVKPTVLVYTDDGWRTGCSTDHLWLVRPCARRLGHKAPLLRWLRADELEPGDELLSLGTWRTDTSRTAGYLAGLLDGEGHLTRNIEGQRKSCQLGFSQLAGPVLDAYLKGMSEVGLRTHHQVRSANSTSPTDSAVTSGVRTVMQVVGTLRPERFIARSESIYEGRAVTAGLTAPVKVLGVKPIGDTELTSIQTSTRTLVANGYLSHNCVQGSAYDVLAHTILEMDRQGLGNHLQLAMHDEVVVDTEVAAEVQRIMLTPPPFLVTWAGRTPVLRTDRADMGNFWRKV